MMIEQGLYSFLSTAPAAVALNTRIYPVWLPQKVTLPAATYRRVATDTSNVVDPDEGVPALNAGSFELVFWDEPKNYLTVTAVARACALALIRLDAPLGGLTFQGIEWEAEDDVADDEARVTGLVGRREQFRIIADET